MNGDQYIIPGNLRQKEDAEISKLYSQVVEVAQSVSIVMGYQGIFFCVINDPLYCKVGENLLVVLPASVRNVVMTIDH